MREKENDRASFPRSIDRGDSRTGSKSLFAVEDLSHLRPLQHSSSSRSSGGEGGILDLAALAQFMSALEDHLKLKR